MHIIILFLRGLSSSLIYFNSSHNHWVLQSLKAPEKNLMMLDNDPAVMPLGTHT